MLLLNCHHSMVKSSFVPIVQSELAGKVNQSFVPSKEMLPLALADAFGATERVIALNRESAVPSAIKLRINDNYGAFHRFQKTIIPYLTDS